MGQINLEKNNVHISILNDLEDFVCCFTPEGTITYANVSAGEILGLHQSELAGKNLGEMLNAQFGLLAKRAIQAINSENPQLEYELEDTQNGDNARWFRWKLRGTFNQHEQLEEIRAIGREISYQKKYEKHQKDIEIALALERAQVRNETDCTSDFKMEQALKESEAKLKNILELAPGMIFVLQGTEFRYANPTMCQLLGYSKEEFRSLDVREIIHPDNQELVVSRALARQRGEIVPTRYVIRLVDRKNSEILIDLTSALIEYDGSPAVLAMGTDITSNSQLRKAWQKTENTFRQLTDTTPACIFIIQGNRYCYVNNFFTSTMGYQVADLVNIHSLDLIHPDYRGTVRGEMEKLQKGDLQIFRQDMRVLPRDAHVCWLDVTVSAFRWEGKPALLGAAYDVTHRIELGLALMQSENNFRQLADTAPTLIFVIANSQLIYVNKAYMENTGYSEKECAQMEPWEFFHAQHWDMIRGMTEARKQGTASFGRYQTRMQPKDGREAWADFSLSQITFNGQPATLGVAIDITEQKQAQLQVEYLSYHDKLTGLYNRAYLEEKAKQLDTPQDQPLSIIIGDLNGLKMVNDAFGHQSGDLMLQKVASILNNNCRKSDFVARWGGDEFVIMLPNCTEKIAQKICMKIYRHCTQINEFPVQVSIALGMATKNSPGQTMEELFKEAEDLMYRNKMLENRSTRSTFLKSLERTLWVRSHETQEHTARLRQLVLTVGRYIGLPPDEMNGLTLLASLHDIGKIAIPNSILDKPARLSPEEWDLMKKHPETGYRIALANPELSPIAEAILNHHERWDGSGYPLGVKGPEIPLISRILALADAYDVMISGRPYQKGIKPEEALKEIMTCAGTQFDPDLALIFIDLMRSSDNAVARQA